MIRLNVDRTLYCVMVYALVLPTMFVESERLLTLVSVRVSGSARLTAAPGVVGANKRTDMMVRVKAIRAAKKKMNSMDYGKFSTDRGDIEVLYMTEPQHLIIVLLPYVRLIVLWSWEYAVFKSILSYLGDEWDNTTYLQYLGIKY